MKRKFTQTKHLLFLAMLMAFCSKGFSQNPAWCFPPNYYAPPFVLPLPQISGGYTVDLANGIDGKAKYASNMYLDAQNNPLFFVIDDAVYDKDGYLIDYIYRGDASATYWDVVHGWGEVLIVPVPGVCKKYYIISAGENAMKSGSVSNSLEPYYAILDLEATNQYDPLRKGALEFLDVNFNTGSNLADVIPSSAGGFYWTPGENNGNISMALSDLRTPTSRYLFMTDGAKIYRFLVTNTGITYDNYFYDLTWTTLRFNSGRNEMELIRKPGNGNYRFAMNGYDFTNSHIFTAEIDYNTGAIVTSSIVDIVNNFNGDEPIFHGLEFSPDANSLYFTHETSSLHLNAIEYYNFSTSTRGFIGSGSAPIFQKSQIEAAQDGSLYLASSSGLAKITNPNNPSGAALVTNVVPFSYYSTNPSGQPEHTTFLIPDQNDQNNYAAHFSQNIVCCNFYNDFVIEKEFYFPQGTTNLDFSVAPSYTVTGSDGISPYTVVFTPTTTARANIHIPAKSNVIFKNLRLEFTPEYIPAVSGDPNDPYIPGAKLIVHQGASSTANDGAMLTVNTSTLTVCTKCQTNSMWPGVEVWGYNSPATGFTHQGTFGTSAQGWVKLNAGSKIEHAVNGIIIGDVNGGQGGAVVEGTSATIENCVRGVFMNPSGNITTNKTKFTLCNFQNTQALIDASKYPFTLVRVDDGVNIYFRGCNFRNLYAPYDQGYYGIKSNSSNLHILSQVATASKFEKLSFGIFALTNVTGRTIDCQRSQFTLNKVGAYLGAVDNATFMTNTFKMIDYKSDQGYFSVGLYMELSSKYTVVGNIFSNNTANIASNPTIGSIIYNSNVSPLGGNSDDNLVYKNTYKKLHFGTQSVDLNYHDLNTSNDQHNEGGLHYHCNTFEAPIVWSDMVTSKTFNSADCAIDHNQGYTLGQNNGFATGNKYSYTWINNVRDILQDDAAWPIQSVWKSGTIFNEEPKTVTTANVTKIPVTTSTNTCGLNAFNYTFTNIYAEVDPKIAELKNLIVAQQAKLEAGSSSQLLNLINSGGSPGQVKNALMDASPYLSKEILVAYLASGAPAGHIKQVFMACSPLQAPVMEKVEQSTLPNGIKNNIRAEQNGTSPYVYGSSQLAYYRAQVDWLYTEVIRTYLNDEVTPNAYQKALEYIKLSYKPTDCKGKKCRYELTIKDEAAALENLHILEQHLASGTPKLEIHKILYELYGKDIKTELDTKPQMKSDLETIAANTEDKESALLAKSILSHVEEVTVEPTFVGLVNTTSRMANPSGDSMEELRRLYAEEEESIETEISLINNYPNPFTGQTTLSALVPKNINKAELVVIDVLGKEVVRYTLNEDQNIISFENEEAKGILYYSLYLDGKRMATKIMMKN